MSVWFSAQHAPRTVDLVVPLVRQSGSDLVTAHARYGFQNATLPFVPKGKILVVTGNDRHMLLVSDPLGDGDAIDELDGVAGIPNGHGGFTLDGTRGRSARLDQILDDLQSVVIRRTGLVRDKLEMSRLTAKRVGGDIARELDLDIIEIPFMEEGTTSPSATREEVRMKDKTGLSEAKSGAMFVGADASPIYS